MKKGLFITFEGPDGSGKTTQIEMLSSFLSDRGEKVLITREPGGTDISEKIRDIILDINNSEMNHTTEMLLYASSRAQLVSQVIKPALEEGTTVICDRFVDSSVAYQGYGRGLGDAVTEVNGYATDGCVPDVTFLMKLDPGVGKSRINDAEMDRLESEKLEFHRRVFEGYEALEKQEPDRIVPIDATGTIEEISAIIKERLTDLMAQNR